LRLWLSGAVHRVCVWQTYETGLFRSQLEDGIMGMSNRDLTLVHKLKVCVRVCFADSWQRTCHAAPGRWTECGKPR
jgi:hypothetical protein